MNEVNHDCMHAAQGLFIGIVYLMITSLVVELMVGNNKWVLDAWSYSCNNDMCKLEFMAIHEEVNHIESIPDVFQMSSIILVYSCLFTHSNQF